MRSDRPFLPRTSLARIFAAHASVAMTSLFAAAMLLAPAMLLPARAQAAQQATLSDSARLDNAKPDTAKSDVAKTPAAQASNAGSVASVDQSGPAAQKSLTSKAIDKVKQVAKSAGDIFSRVPCLPAKRGAQTTGSLPHVASKLAAGKPVVIIAFGSSSTQGYGSSSPEFNYPNRLAAQLHRQYPGADITVLNHGVVGEDAPEMMKRLQTSVLDAKPDLVIWQGGTNALP